MDGIWNNVHGTNLINCVKGHKSTGRGKNFIHRAKGHLCKNYIDHKTNVGIVFQAMYKNYIDHKVMDGIWNNVQGG